MKRLLLFTLSLLSLWAEQEQKGEIQGTVFKLQGKTPLAGVYVTLYRNYAQVQTEMTDSTGHYIFRALPEGDYRLEASYEGIDSTVTISIAETHAQIKHDFYVDLNAKNKHAEADRAPVYDRDATTAGETYTVEEIKKMPTRSVAGVISSTSGTYRAGRRSSDAYIVDGAKLESAPTFDKELKVVGEEIPAPAPEPGPIFEYDKSKPKAGILTAGERNDLEHWNDWLKLMDSVPGGYQSYLWTDSKNKQLSLRLRDKNGNAIQDAKAWLEDEQGNLIAEANTGPDGLALFQPKMKDNHLHKMQLKYTYGSVTENLGEIQDIQTEAVVDKESKTSHDVDIMFVVDATGSMGDEMKFLKTELEDVIQRIKDSTQEQINLRLSVIFYRDHRDEYVVRSFPFTGDVEAVIHKIEQQHADGGGDFPEAVDEALLNGVNEQDWRKDTRTKLMFLILDAPPHDADENVERMKKAISAAEVKGIRIIPITASGIDKPTEYMMRAIAIRTGGTYVFLTDDSGVGDPHLKPSVPDYKVELLNDLVVRLALKYIGH